MRYGLVFLPLRYFTMPLKDSDKKVPAEAAALIKHLEQSGTGRSKLDKLTELAKTAKNGDEFLASAKLMVPPGTWSKIETYLAEQGDVELRTAPQNAGERVESRSNTQSSIPEFTIRNENKAVQLREPGSTKVRQLGSDVIVKGDNVPSEPSHQEQGDEVQTSQESASDASEESQGEVESPVKDMPAEEARQAVTRMTSKERLEAVILGDNRVTVQKAAQSRLDELNAKK